MKQHSLDPAFYPTSAAFLGAGLIAWVVGYGLKPLAVAGCTVLVLRQIYRNVETNGRPLAIYPPSRHAN